MRVKAHRAKITLNRFLGRLYQHLHDTEILTGYAAPSFAPEEISKARALASQVHSELRKQTDGDPNAASRIAMLAVVEAYRMQVYGVIQFIENEQTQAKAKVDTLTGVPNEPAAS